MINSQFAIQRLEATDPNGLTLRVDFVRLVDRYGHVLSVVEPDGQVHPILESVEGTAADDWPASPPLQNLSIEELSPGRRVALLVGMAGRNHWSASIEPVPGKAAFVFDIACRAAPQSDLSSRLKHDAVPALFSEYRCVECPDGVAIVDENDETGEQPDRDRWSFFLAPLHCTQHSSISSHSSVLHAPAKERAYGCTVRWQYLVELRLHRGNNS